MKEVSLHTYKVTMDYVFSEIPSEKTIVNTINPHSYITAKKDKLFAQALQNSDVLLPDGIGIIWAIKKKYGIQAEKVAGADFHEMILKKLNELHSKIFYLGGAKKTLTSIEKRIEKEFPNIQTSSYSPPFKDDFSNQENQEMVRLINDFNPDVLFVGMTAPKQEKWIENNKHHLNVKVISGIGAVFDFFGGTRKRPPQWMIHYNMEWLGRFLKEPRRMWKRNFISTPLFILEILAQRDKTQKDIPPC